jgi:hypothetical protein
MGFRRSMGALVIIAATVLLCEVGAHAGDTDAAITVLVQNSARISAPIMNKALLETSRIFHAAGIDIAWMQCAGGFGRVDDACHRTPGPKQFVLHIVSKGKTSSDLVFGLAFLDEAGEGKYSDVFVDRIEEVHLASGADVSRLLGTVAAHELGHLLLGNHAHSYVGVMTPVWKSATLRREDMGCLWFTPEQATRMRARIGDVERASLRWSGPLMSNIHLEH